MLVAVVVHIISFVSLRFLTRVGLLPKFGNYDCDDYDDDLLIYLIEVVFGNRIIR